MRRSTFMAIVALMVGEMKHDDFHSNILRISLEYYKIVDYLLTYKA